jgi:hypothetical protein
METSTMQPQETRSQEGTDRRAFLAKAGKFAVDVPPAMTMLLSTTMSSPAIAQTAAMPPSSGGTPPPADGGGGTPAPAPTTVRTRRR